MMAVLVGGLAWFVAAFLSATSVFAYKTTGLTFPTLMMTFVAYGAALLCWVIAV